MFKDMCFEDNRLIIYAERFYDNLKLLKNGQEQFKNESKIRLGLILEECDKHLLNGSQVVIKNNGGYETVFKSKDKFIEWLTNKERVELGSEYLNGLNINFVIHPKK